MGEAPSFGDTTLFGERFAVTFRYRTPKPVARMLAPLGLFRGPGNGGESLGPCRLERAKGFEPSISTLATLRTACADPQSHAWTVQRRLDIPQSVQSPLPYPRLSPRSEHPRAAQALSGGEGDGDEMAPTTSRERPWWSVVVQGIEGIGPLRSVRVDSAEIDSSLPWFAPTSAHGLTSACGPCQIFRPVSPLCGRNGVQQRR
jgi:hypothetical protein